MVQLSRGTLRQWWRAKFLGITSSTAAPPSVSTGPPKVYLPPKPAMAKPVAMPR